MKALMFYLFSQVAIHDKELLDYGKVKSLPFDTTLEVLKKRACQILQIICSDVFYLDLLWPMTLEIINNQKFSPGLSFICKSLCTLLTKAKAIDSKLILVSPPYPRISITLILKQTSPNSM
jgi:hypothetical protein